MNRHGTTRGLPATLATVAVLLSACTGDPTAATETRHLHLAASPMTPPIGRRTPLGAPRTLYYDKGEFVHDVGERNVAVPPGVYAVPFSGWGDLPREVADLRAVITFPAGFLSLHRSTFAENRSGPNVREFAFWTVDKVPSDFCDEVGFPASFTNPGPTVADLATALATQPRLGGTDPVPVTIGGYDGLYVELTRPAASCPGRVLWFAPRIAHAAYHERFTDPGDVARLWILNVDGHRVVIDTIHPANASDAEVTELTQMVESATFINLDRRGEPGIPTTVHDPIGDGGLKLERDLAVGGASVAIANDTAAFVITADDGVYHRLDLPNFDPALYDAGGSEVSGLTLSPDGTKLIYGWQGASDRPQESGARMVDLLTGEVVTLDRQALYDEPARLLPWGFSWSPDSRFVINRVKIADPEDPWASSPHWQQGLDTKTGRTFGISERAAGLELEADDDLASTSRVFSPRLGTRFFGDELTLGDSHGGYRVGLPQVPTDPASEPSTGYQVWVTGQFDATGTQLLLEPDRIAGSLALVGGLTQDDGLDPTTGHDPKTTVLRMTDGPADALLLGWVGQNHALAVMDNDFSDSLADLVLLALDAEAGEAEGTVVGHVSVSDGDLSFATDLASVTTPTRDFEADNAITEEDATDDSTPGSTSPSSWSTTALVGGAAVLALAGALIVTVRRRRAAARPN